MSSFGSFNDFNRLSRQLMNQQASSGILGSSDSTVRRENLGSVRSSSAFGKEVPTDDPQRGYMWEVEMDNPLNDKSSHIKYYAISSSIPSYNTDAITRYYAGVPYTINGKDTSPRTFRMSLWDNQQLEMYRFMSRWFQASNAGEDFKKSSPYSYYRNITLRLKDNSDSFDSLVITLTDAFPTEISDTTLTFNESSAIGIDVVFSFNNRIIT